ncbi:restriction endonuclease [Alkaliphilus hydrothermalis]|nr:restriction endonuclease [Alkaliphilus hydrothermalis]
MKPIIASPDGLGLEEPSIIVEVKHRTGSMGADSIRSFTGGLRNRDKGLCVSTGGFSKGAKYEAERSNIPVTLIDAEELVRWINQYYDHFDWDTRALVPLKKTY